MPEGDRGAALSNVVCFVVCMDGEAREGSYARSGSAPPVRTAEGAFGREKDDWDLGDVGKDAPGLGDDGSEGSEPEGNRAPGLGDEGRPTRGALDRSETAETGSASVGACDGLREWPKFAPNRSSMLIVLSGDMSGGVMGAICEPCLMSRE